MKGLFAAIRFLTILPVPGDIGTDTESLAKSPVYFPFTGLLIGIAAAIIISLIEPILPLPLTVAAAIILLLTASGALHLDGVADCADGFFSSRPREKILAIMRDSRIGPMGVIAIIIILMLKAAALISIPGNKLWQAVLFMPVAGRAAIVMMMWITPYARPEGGLGAVFYKKNMLIPGLSAIIFLFAAGYICAEKSGLITAAIIFITVIMFSLYCRRKITGATGDTLGAVCEISETLCACALAALPAFPLHDPFCWLAYI